MPKEPRRSTPPPEPPAKLTFTLDVTTVLLALAITAVMLLVLVVVVGVIRESLNLTSVASVIAVLAGGIVTGVTVASRGAEEKKKDGPP